MAVLGAAIHEFDRIRPAQFSLSHHSTVVCLRKFVDARAKHDGVWAIFDA
jgi:hypothetical protein